MKTQAPAASCSDYNLVSLHRSNGTVLYHPDTALAEGLRGGHYVPAAICPASSEAGMAVISWLFPLLPQISGWATNFSGHRWGGFGVRALGALWWRPAYSGLLTPSAAFVIWLVGVFGPGWWLISQYAEKHGYYS